jgi:23S rRNA (cytosine1962-C5)-methyltransferase
VNWAKENAQASGLSDTAIRWIVDDVLKFVKREVRRGKTYDLILLDPPVFGRGPKGEIWRIEKGIAELLEEVAALLSQNPLGLLCNFYATATYPESIVRLARQSLGETLGSLELGSLLIEETSSKKQLPTGFFLRS